MTRELKFGHVAAASGTTKSMIVFVHGYGADGADLLGLADPLAGHLPDTVFVHRMRQNRAIETRLGINGFRSLGLMVPRKRLPIRGFTSLPKT